MEDKIEKLFIELESSINDDYYYDETIELIHNIKANYQEQENIILTIKDVLALQQNDYSALFKEAYDKGIINKEAYDKVYRKLFKKEAKHTIILSISEGRSDFMYTNGADTYTAIKNKIDKYLKKNKDCEVTIINSTELLALELLATENYWNIVCEYKHKEYKFDPYDLNTNLNELHYLMNKEYMELQEKLEKTRGEKLGC